MNSHLFVHWILVSIVLLSGCSQETRHQAERPIEVKALLQQNAKGNSFRESKTPGDPGSGTDSSPLVKFTAAAMVPADDGINPQDSRSIDSPLAIRIELDSSEEPPTIEIEKPFRIVLTNTSDTPLKIWNPQLKNGYPQWSFRFTDPETREVHVVTKRRIDDPKYWEIVRDPNSEVIEMAPSDTFTFRVRLHDIQWGERVWEGLPGPDSGQSYQMAINLESKLAAPNDDPPIWIGDVQSQSRTVRLVAERFKTPHDYLSNGFPGTALNMMKADKQWIGRKNEYASTPLHLAAGCGNTKVVRWLLENGADVNAIGFNGSTPLHAALHPEVLSLLLKHSPDLTIRNRSYGHTPLQTVTAAFVEVQDADRKDNLRELIKLYLEAGADYDPLVAIRLDDLERLKAILQQSPELADNFQNQSLLRMAASLGRVDICRYLIEEHDVDVNDFGRGQGYPIIKEALAYAEVVHLLIESGADLKTLITWRGFSSGPRSIGDEATLLHFAARDGVPESINLLMDNGAEIFATAKDLDPAADKRTALEIAALFGETNNALAILTHPQFDQGDPQTRQRVLDKSLLLAATPLKRHKQLELMKSLLEKGADPNSSRNGQTVLQWASRWVLPMEESSSRKKRKLIALLAAHGAALDLFSAVAINDEASVTRLLQHEPESANTRAPDGCSAMHLAVRMDNLDIIQLLLDAGADVDIRNKKEHTGSIDDTPLHWAASWSRIKIAQLLIEAGADVNARNFRRQTPLHDAALMPNLSMIRLLLENGAQVDAQDEGGMTPLDHCRKRNRGNPDEVEKILLQHTGNEEGRAD